MTTPADVSELSLIRVSGPEMDPIRLTAREEPWVIGRGTGASIRLEHKAVSRRHAVVEPGSGRWYVRDLGSRHGTALNGVRLEAGEMTPLNEGDRLRILPWTFLVRTDGTSHERVRTYEDSGSSDAVHTLMEEPSQTTPADLAVLLRSTSALHDADDEESFAAVLLDGLVACGFERAAVLMQVGSEESVEVLASRARGGSEPGDFMFSRTLLRAAGQGQLAHVFRHGSGTPVDMTSSGIAGGVCAPIWLDNAIWGYLYGDSLAPHETMDRAVPLIRSISQIASDALARLKRIELRERLQSLHVELSLAAKAQALLMPGEAGETDAVLYAARSVHGRAVTGDLLDVIALSPGRTAVVLGDVVGKGAGAGMIMVLAQSFLHARLTAGQGLSESFAALNEHLCGRLQQGQFISLWGAVFDAEAGTMEFVDAGHGYAAMVGGGADPELLDGKETGGVLLGIQHPERYPSRAVEVPRGRRVVVFSDGLVEQVSPGGEQFGVARLMAAAADSASCGEDVERVFEAIQRHAGGQSLTDDATLVSVEFAARG